jgi:hypothetical protein
VDCVSLRNSVVPAALALAGCLPSGSQPPPSLQQLTYQTAKQGGACKVESVTYHLRGELVRADSSIDKSSASLNDNSRVRSGALLVSVAEGSSVVECSEDIVRIASPGAELHTAAFGADADSFALDLPSAIIGGQRPSIWVQALIDANDNGRCDEGELVGALELEDSELGDIAIALSNDGCPTRS